MASSKALKTAGRDMVTCATPRRAVTAERVLYVGIFNTSRGANGLRFLSAAPMAFPVQARALGHVAQRQHHAVFHALSPQT
jgi:hypothetical protein